MENLVDETWHKNNIKSSFNKAMFAKHFQVIIHFHPGHPWPKTLVNSFTELVWCLTNILPFYISFLTDTPFAYPPLKNGTPFTYLLKNTTSVGMQLMNNIRWEQFYRKMLTKKTILLSTQNILIKSPFKYLNDRFPYPFIYFSSWNPYPSIYLKPEKGTPFGWSLPV